MTGNNTTTNTSKNNIIGYASIAELSSQQANLSDGDCEKFVEKLCDSLWGCFHDHLVRTISKVGTALSAHRYQDRWGVQLNRIHWDFGVFFWVETNKNGDVTINNIVRSPPTIQPYTQSFTHMRVPTCP